MFLIPTEIVLPHISPYYTTYRQGSELLGFYPCTRVGEQGITYYSEETPMGGVVPVFYVPDMVFDSQENDYTPRHALFFMGCDDGHTGLIFDSKQAALSWLAECPYMDFALLFKHLTTTNNSGIQWHN